MVQTHRTNTRMILHLSCLAATATGFAGNRPLWAQGPDDDSRDRLIRKTRGVDEDDIMSRIIRQMDQCEHRLSELFDVGAETQTIQEQVVKNLEEAIEQARQNMRVQKSSAPQKGDPTQEGQTDDDAESGEGDTAAGDEPSEGVHGGDEAETATGGHLRERRRQWGNLPPRDRDEIMQSVNEDFHERYREQIDRYYDALSKMPGNE